MKKTKAQSPWRLYAIMDEAQDEGVNSILFRDKDVRDSQNPICDTISGLSFNFVCACQILVVSSTLLVTLCK